jgi:hypothetical protein
MVKATGYPVCEYKIFDTRFDYLFYKSGLISRIIVGIGFTGATFVLISALLEMHRVIFEISARGDILAIPQFNNYFSFNFKSNSPKNDQLVLTRIKASKFPVS